MRAKMIDAKGVRTRILYEGKGPAIVLVHGVGGLAEHWFNNIDELAKDHYVVAPDLAGHGFTERIRFDGEAPHPKTVDHLLNVVDALGIDRFSICGSSYGALISSLLYLKIPDRVTKLIMCGSGSVFHSVEDQATALAGAYANGMSAMKDPSLKSCRERLGNICYDPETVPDATALANLLSIAMPGVIEAYEEAIRGMMDVEKTRPYRIVERLEQIQLPTLVIWGREDPRGIYQRAVENMPRFPNVRFVTLEKCGHLPFLEHPQQFNAEVRRFLLDGVDLTGGTA